ncbi:MAG: hypothetical protein BGP10_01755 [Rhodanobacter sp. 68-29]|nr:hypothetical protein [Rhodanobacter sp.]ODU74729.1 MAG: hypothetical protein ABT17_07140 [Rhodanobacter sp. SCN 69-32]OJY57557.1 MAG: hypothetical protein BGP10_01755 [Rhodanobacter sp. 68-29]
MFDMFLNSARLFLRGKLFQNSSQVLKQWLVGLAITLAVLLALALLVNPLIAAISGGLLGGALMPYLFKDLKYR